MHGTCLRKTQRFYWYPHHLVRHRGQSPRPRWQACNSGGWPGGRIVTIRRVRRNRNDGAVAGDSPRSRRHRGNEMGRWPANGARYDTKVHGTCGEKLRDFIGIRIIWCGTGDSPRGHGCRCATAAVGRAVDGKKGLLRRSGACHLQRHLNPPVTVRATAARTASGTHQSLTGRLTSTAGHTSFL